MCECLYIRVCVTVCVRHVYVRARVCVCVRVVERERTRAHTRESVCVCVRICVHEPAGTFVSGQIRISISRLQHTATLCSTLQHSATHCNTLQQMAKHCNTLQHTATHGNTRQHTATHCNTLQHMATHGNILPHSATLCNSATHEPARTSVSGKVHISIPLPHISLCNYFSIFVKFCRTIRQLIWPSHGTLVQLAYCLTLNCDVSPNAIFFF